MCSPGYKSTGMARPQILAGELGKIVVGILPSGRYRARAEIRRQAMAISIGGSGALSPSNTIAVAVELWLSQILTRTKAGSLAYSTYESYETTARVTILPRCGGV